MKGVNRVLAWVFGVAGVAGCISCVSIDPGNPIAWVFGAAVLLAALIVIAEHR